MEISGGYDYEKVSSSDAGRYDAVSYTHLFLTAPIFTRLLTTEEYGVITIYLSWVDVIGIFAMFGLYNNVYCRGILEFKEDKKNFTFSLLSLANVITLAVFAIVWITNK